MNKVILMGRLTSDPEIRYTQNKLAIARYTLAVDRKGHTENTADFIRCVAFDHAAEFAEKYFKQGTKIIITGRIQTGSYTNKDGQKVYITEVVTEEQEFAESKSANKPKQQETPSANPNGFMNIPDGVEDEDLPFN
jgi:single-strand DNA-binding protein